MTINTGALSIFVGNALTSYIALIATHTMYISLIIFSFIFINRSLNDTMAGYAYYLNPLGLSIGAIILNFVLLQTALDLKGMSNDNMYQKLFLGGVLVLCALISIVAIILLLSLKTTSNDVARSNNQNTRSSLMWLLFAPLVLLGFASSKYIFGFLIQILKPDINYGAYFDYLKPIYTVLFISTLAATLLGIIYTKFSRINSGLIASIFFIVSASIIIIITITKLDVSYGLLILLVSGLMFSIPLLHRCLRNSINVRYTGLIYGLIFLFSTLGGLLLSFLLMASSEN